MSNTKQGPGWWLGWAVLAAQARGTRVQIPSTQILRSGGKKAGVGCGVPGVASAAVFGVVPCDSSIGEVSSPATLWPVVSQDP